MSFNTEEKLLKGCQSGQTKAQEALYRLYSPTMFGICLRYGSDYHTAEDILQDGFIKVFKNIRQFKNNGSLEGWIRRIFVNTAIEYYRKTTRSFRFSPLEVVVEKSVNDHQLMDLERDELLRLIQQLPDGYRLVFNLYVIEGFSHQEIAEKLKVNLGTSKSQLARAKKYLRKLILAQQASEEKTLQQARSYMLGYV